MPLLATGVFAANKLSDIRTTRTKHNIAALLKDFRFASNAKIRYKAFAVKADAEGYAGMANLFRAAELSEGIRAAKQAKVIEALGAVPTVKLATPTVKTTDINLSAAMTFERLAILHLEQALAFNRAMKTAQIRDSEKVAGSDMPPAFAKQILADENEIAVMSFKGALAVVTSHTDFLYPARRAKFDSWKAKRKFRVCQTCGYISSYTQGKLNVIVCPICSQPLSLRKPVE